VVAGWRAAGVRIAATAPRGGAAMHDVDFTAPVAVLIGGEGGGLPDELAATADLTVSIPMHNGIESLNAAVAGAVILYEALRQRRR